MDNKFKKKNKNKYSDSNIIYNDIRRGRNGIIFPTSKNYHDEDVMFSEFDLQGSYTGVSENDLDKPIQDADDL